MNSNPHKIFVTTEDRWSWDKYIEQCDLIDLSEIDRRRAKDSFQYLRGILGEGYLKRAASRGNPMFFWYFANAANRARLSMIRFTKALKALEGAPNYQAILRRIKRPTEFDELAEGMSVIEVAHKFSRAGFTVEFEPDVSVKNHRGVAGLKKPDMKIIDGEAGEEIIVEVSRMKPSDHQNLTERTYHIIWDVLVRDGMWHDPEALKDIMHPRHILPYARIHRGIEDDELKGIVARVRNLIDQVRTSGEFGELIIPETIEVGIASYENHTRAREWAATRGIGDNEMIEGPSIVSDEIARAKVKLRRKIKKQIPDDRPGIVVLSAKHNLIFFVYDIRGLAAALAEEVEKHPKLLCAVMFHTFDDGGSDSQSVDIGEHTLIRQVRSDGAIEQSLIIRNPACKHPVAIETLDKVRSAFIMD
jgi:hypothetical protein